MPVRLHFEVFGETQVDRTLARPGEAADDMRPVWEVLADRLVVIEERQFRTEGRYGSGGWDPLSPPYAAWKARNYPGQTILRRTDDLYRSLTSRPLGVEVIEPSFMVLGSDVEYGGFHQRGDPPVPRRRVVELTEAERRNWVKVMQRYIITGSLGSARASSLADIPEADG